MAGAGDIPVGAGSASEAIDVPARQPVNIGLIRRFKAKHRRASLARSEARFVPEDGLTAAGNWLATPELGVVAEGSALGSAPARTY